MSNSQIIALYENDGLSPEEIQSAMPEYSIEAIRITLANNSAKYRRAIKKNSDLFNDEDLEMASGVMRELMITCDVPAVRYRSAKYVIDEKKGRHDKMKAGDMGNININLINLQLTNAQKALKRAREQIIDIPEESKALINAA